ncbi:hypothetical protein [Agrobacterium pusense]|uniref:hypothetical protein n=1 Tax=Agrobacterium pusense TaxID=648995 RepID=UPI0018910BB0|nr:hypothetical protein [Agrobacterium pusense]
MAVSGQLVAIVGGDVPAPRMDHPRLVAELDAFHQGGTRGRENEDRLACGSLTLDDRRSLQALFVGLASRQRDCGDQD